MVFQFRSRVPSGHQKKISLVSLSQDSIGRMHITYIQRILQTQVHIGSTTIYLNTRIGRFQIDPTFYLSILVTASQSILECCPVQIGIAAFQLVLTRMYPCYAYFGPMSFKIILHFSCIYLRNDMLFFQSRIS